LQELEELLGPKKDTAAATSEEKVETAATEAPAKPKRARKPKAAEAAIETAATESKEATE